MEAVRKKIPFLNIKRQYETIAAPIHEAIQKVIDITAFAGGPFAATFEKEFAEFCGCDYSVSCNSGTSALHLALLALEIQPGDEVILPANTFVATAWAISYVGAKPVFVDCDENNNIDPKAIEASITSKTKCVMAVHLYGQPADMDPIMAICKKHNLYLVEDAAQAHGAKYKGKTVGSFGDISCFSFYPGKNLGAFGEGGGICTNSKAYYEKMQKIKNHGSTKKYYHDEVGYNMRMDGIQAAVLSVKLKHLEGWNNRRKEIAKRYHTELNNNKVTLPLVPDFSDSVYHLFVVTVADRKHFMDYMAEQGIYCGIHYPVPCHLQKAYADLNHKVGDFPNSEALANSCVSLPMFAELTDEEIDTVIKAINAY